MARPALANGANGGDYHDAHDFSVPLDHLYFMGSILLLSTGLFLCVSTLRLFAVVRHRLNNPIILSYVALLVPDMVTALNFLTRDFANLAHGSLRRGGWCKFSSFLAMSSVTALHLSNVCLSYSTLSMVRGAPSTEHYQDVQPSGLGTGSSTHGHFRTAQPRTLMTHFYWQAFVQLQIKESSLYLDHDGSHRASTRLYHSSLTLLSVTYGCWFIIVVVGFLTLGGRHYVHPGWDLLGAWAAKLQPSLDAIILTRIITRATSVRAKGGNKRPSSMESSGKRSPSRVSAVAPDLSLSVLDNLSALSVTQPTGSPACGVFAPWRQETLRTGNHGTHQSGTTVRPGDGVKLTTTRCKLSGTTSCPDRVQVKVKEVIP